MMKRRGHGRGQRFVKADYYELDWYYDECTDGKAALCSGRGESPTHAREVGQLQLFSYVKRRAGVLGLVFFVCYFLISRSSLPEGKRTEQEVVVKHNYWCFMAAESVSSDKLDRNQ